ncbi:hypothetical protein ACOTDN_08080 [Achromobacter xylosoxidans]|uniref:hypothetical protein n=1 Tax=Alcaligenes xylosoxydans xylosoxydans TaxID=85698 RepID=UPI000332305C|nr:hypothetical protein [Achromobacter xylosoxidans]KMJ91294.1 membrane protein [Achromobacter xylosoxidans]CCH08693.1 hypothetical protein NH44784_047501 [Achromobacter xylosoxidans NH44784-1996]
MKTKNYLFGIIVSLVLATLLAFLGLVAVSSDNLGWGMAALLSYGVLFGGPLAIVLVLTWIVYLVRDRGQVPARVHGLLFLPSLVALMIVPIDDQIRRAGADRFRGANPAITENHVNFSGRTLWLDYRAGSSTDGGGQPYMEPASATNDRFSRFRRYPGPDLVAAGTFPYAGAHLKPDVERYAYSSQDGQAGDSLPLRRLPAPDLGKLLPAFAYGEAALLVYQYFHYPDHVEVAPSLGRFAASTEDAMTAARVAGLAIVSLDNHTPHAIARLEINGQTLDLGGDPARSQAGQPCDPARGGSPAMLDLEQPLRVRWQTLQDPSRWQEARVVVPAFSAASQADPDKGLPRVRLYFLPDGSVAAERFREMRLRGGDLAVRATGVPPQAQAVVACGAGAYSGYNPQTVRLLGN